MSMIDGKELEEHKPKISEEARLEFAAIAWTFPETSHKVMDPVLAKAFAEVIDIIVNGGFNTVESYVQFKEATQDFHKE
ncbi:hypothetical protein LCGC14_2124630 [marine sediment metagenome]|uniref:Uncharacterized protein n=1 Tax=marine sediment metagenome TaxID=412755 RepID=A0A0F9GGB4_9ZZZZ